MRFYNFMALGLLPVAIASVCKPSPVLSSMSSSTTIEISAVSSYLSTTSSILSSIPSSSSASSSAAAQPTCGVNVITNGDFSSTDGWDFVDNTGAGQFTIETDGPSGYSTYLKYTTSGAGTSEMSTTFTTIPGMSYTVAYSFECTSDIGITGIHVIPPAGTAWVQSVTAMAWTQGAAGTFVAASTSSTLTFTFSSNEYLTLGFTNIEAIGTCVSAP